MFLKKTLVFSSIIILLITGISFTQNVGSTAGNFTARDYFGKSQSITKYRGKVVLLKFWATWCGPCRASLPKTNALYKRYGSRGLIVFAVGLGGQQMDQKYLRSKGYRFHVMVDGKKYRGFRRYYKFRGIPHEYLISSTGKIIWRGHPARFNTTLLEKALENVNPNSVSPRQPQVQINPNTRENTNDNLSTVDKIKYMMRAMVISIKKFASYRGRSKYRRYVKKYIKRARSIGTLRYALLKLEEYIRWDMYRRSWQIRRKSWIYRTKKARTYSRLVKQIRTLMRNIPYRKSVYKNRWKKYNKNFFKYARSILRNFSNRNRMPGNRGRNRRYNQSGKSW